VIGAGTIGGGIAMNFANIGMPVVLLEHKHEALGRGLAQIRKNCEISVKRGKLSQEQLEQRMPLLQGTLDYADLADADLVFEAVLESIEVKRQVFATLNEVCKSNLPPRQRGSRAPATGAVPRQRSGARH
jgi:3-hydroxyacyl-CoA dehydrogenase